MTTNLLLCGVGGQGTVLASKLLASAAMHKGLHVRTAETIGMAQRGGCVVSHVRMSDGEIFSSLIPKGTADMIIAFEPSEAVRCESYLKPDGTVIVSTKAIQPVTMSLDPKAAARDTAGEMLAYLTARYKTVCVDTEKICAELGSPKVMNMVLLNAAAATGCLGITAEELCRVVKARVSPKFVEMNLAALRLDLE
ncbi:MAG: indolepyruvate oxidoreductase subunit beta [Oscillospiraceae bacterium]